MPQLLVFLLSICALTSHDLYSIFLHALCLVVVLCDERMSTGNVFSCERTKLERRAMGRGVDVGAGPCHYPNRHGGWYRRHLLPGMRV